jgi:outer membrane biosynthesis protein TonB
MGGYCSNLKRTHASTLIGIIGIAAGLTVLLALPIQIIYSATPTIKVPGPYPYETPVQVPAPPLVSDSSPAPSPAPFPYPESSPSLSVAQDRDSRTMNARRPVTAKAVRETAFKYNGVANFCGFLAALPADVSVFDPKLGRTRTLVKGGRVIPKNVAWLRKHRQAPRT